MVFKILEFYSKNFDGFVDVHYGCGQFHDNYFKSSFFISLVSISCFIDVGKS
jgi:hypothetical protein